MSVVEDAELVLAAGGDAEGIAIVCGTGSIVLGGGLVAERSMRAPLEAALAEELPGWPVELLREAPVAGAVALALEALAAAAAAE